MKAAAITRTRALTGLLLATVALAAAGCSERLDRAEHEAASESGTGIAWRRGSLEEVLAEARAQEKLVFVDFWTSWCGWCKRLDQDTFSDPAVIEAVNERFVSLSVDAESKSGRPIARRYGVSGYPTLLILEPDGTVRERIGGYLPPDRFLARVAAESSAR
jgi:thiol:disulfide interchange protein